MRDRSQALLRKLDTKFCTAVGISADWGLISKWFLRLFDVAGHDIAKSRCEIDCMIETLDAVFTEGRVFDQLLNNNTDSVADDESIPQIPSAGSAANSNIGFITGKVMRNLRRRFVFFAGGIPVLLWKEPPAAHKQELLTFVQHWRRQASRAERLRNHSKFGEVVVAECETARECLGR